ncbi:MAG: amidohydrolase [Gemmatimonadaceae bacterium]|nr:amidohydrolase [Gemmatimonadaceae bacterium]
MTRAATCLLLVLPFVAQPSAVGAQPHCPLAIGTGAVAAGAPDLVLVNARVYSFAWADPDGDGRPSARAPFRDGAWRPDASALAIRDGRIVAVGTDAAIVRRRGPRTVVRDLEGRTVLPGFVDAHTHVAEYGESLRRVDLVGVRSTAEALARVERWLAREQPPADAWILGQGWDEGAWADTALTAAALDTRFPGRAVYLRGLHGFAGWASSEALRRAGITRTTPAPIGGVIDRDRQGAPAGRVRNRAVRLLDDAIPLPTPAEAQRAWRLGLEALADSGYVGVHEAGVDAVRLGALERMASDCTLPIRVHAMLSTRDTALAQRWLQRGPDTTGRGGLVVRSVKAYYDGALGSRGARLLEPYADAPTERGLAGAAYGFDSALVARLMERGFQAAIHAIGDAGNRDVIDLIAQVQASSLAGRGLAHRIEHAQILAAPDIPRLAALGIVPSIQPVHAVEDLRWAGQRLGTTRLAGAYAWRSLRQAGARPPLGSDLPGSGFGLGYGLHSAVTRRDTTGQPREGWFPLQRLTIEEAVRGYGGWARRAALEPETHGRLVVGAPADLTILDRDPMTLASSDVAALLRVRPCAIVVGGRWRDGPACRPERDR